MILFQPKLFYWYLTEFGTQDAGNIYPYIIVCIWRTLYLKVMLLFDALVSKWSITQILLFTDQNGLKYWTKDTSSISKILHVVVYYGIFMALCT